MSLIVFGLTSNIDDTETLLPLNSVCDILSTPADVRRIFCSGENDKDSSRRIRTCRGRAKNVPRTCRGRAEDVPRTCRGRAEDVPRTCRGRAEDVLLSIFPRAPARCEPPSAANALNVTPTVSSDQLLLVLLGHTPVAGDRPPHAGPSHLRAVNRPRLSTPPDQGLRFQPVGPAHPDSDGYALKCSSDGLE